jgi:glutamate 5-kinase
MTNDARLFNSINTNDSTSYDSITFGDNEKGKVKGLG